VKLAALLLLALSAGCMFDAEEARNCYYEATIGCGPGCPPRVVKQMIVCPSEPAQPDAGAAN
jgi:hypothetical protein